MSSHRTLVGSLAFETPSGTVMSDTRIRLLEAIARHGSLTRAAKDVPLSYRAAWLALDAMNADADAPLVVRTTGGRAGGGTRLTEHGQRLVALYRAMESSQQAILDQVAAPQALADAAGGGSLRGRLRRMTMKTSARNQFHGVVERIEDHGGMAAVHLRLDLQDTLVASITPESVRTMGLAPGAEVYALVKAPAVDMLAAAPRAGVNVHAGEVTQVEPGPTWTRIALRTDAGRTIAAAPAREVAQRRPLGVGQRAWARIDPDSVILVSFD